MTNYNSWWQWHVKQDCEGLPPVILMPECSVELLNHWLPIYVSETRNQEGKRYSPKTLYSLLMRILHYMRLENPHYPNFLDKANPDFAVFHRSVDNTFRKLCEEENMLWEKGILNTTTPKGLFKTVFYNGKNVILLGGEEHRQLKVSQIVCYHYPDCYVYTENLSKNRSGGITSF